MIENLVVTLIVVAAAVWVLRNMYRSVKAAISGRASSCGSCGSCAKADTNATANATANGQSRTVVSIGSKPRASQG
jgi:hypothetical protein